MRCIFLTPCLFSMSPYNATFLAARPVSHNAMLEWQVWYFYSCWLRTAFRIERQCWQNISAVLLIRSILQHCVKRGHVWCRGALVTCDASGHDLVWGHNFSHHSVKFKKHTQKGKKGETGCNAEKQRWKQKGKKEQVLQGFLGFWRLVLSHGLWQLGLRREERAVDWSQSTSYSED